MDFAGMIPCWTMLIKCFTTKKRIMKQFLHLKLNL